MSDFGWYLAGAFGFALVCVLTVVWLLSKRTVNVHQVQENHAAPVIVNAGGDGAGLGLAPKLIGGLFKMLTVGIVLTVIANLALAGISGIGSGLQSIGNGLSQQAAPQPQPIVVNYPTAVPVQRVEPIYVPQSSPQSAQKVEWLPVAIVALAVAATSLWGYVAVTLWRRRTIKRPNVISGPRPVSAREVFGVATDARTKETVRR